MTKLMKKKRQPYRWGAKRYLAEMEIGEQRADDGRFVWKNVQATASRLANDYGSRFKFTTTPAGRFVTRVM